MQLYFVEKPELFFPARPWLLVGCGRAMLLQPFYNDKDLHISTGGRL